MLCSFVLAILWIGGGRAGVADRGEEHDVSKYWEEDFKALGHLYAKTSDKDLYGASLPPPIIFNVDRAEVNREVLEKTKHAEASEQMHHISESAQNFSNVPSINNNMESKTYNYLKYLEQRQKQDAEHLDKEEFTPYFGSNSDRDGDYSSSESLFSHANEAKGVGDVVAESSTYYGTNKARSKVRFLKGNALDSRRMKCRDGICRNKTKTSKRFYSRPVRKIKKIVYNY